MAIILMLIQRISRSSRVAAATTVLLCLELVAGLIGGGQTAYATNYTSNATGYAMGAIEGASGTPMDYSYFANHWPKRCPNDPSSSWNWNTSIQMVSPADVVEYDSDAFGLAIQQLYLEDIGDFQCAQPNYWIDIYFGRVKHAADNCYCNNATDTCVNGLHNNCQDAVNWGNTTITYETLEVTPDHPAPVDGQCLSNKNDCP